MQIDVQRLRNSIKGTGWAKFLAIVYYVLGAIYILGCVTIPLGIFMFIIGIKTWNAASDLERLKYTDDPERLYSALDNIGSMFVWSGIFIVVTLVLYAILLVVYIAFLSSMMSTMYTL